MKDLPRRLLSALLFLLIMLGGIFGGAQSFLLLLALIGLLCLREFVQLSFLQGDAIGPAARGLVVLLALWPYFAIFVWYFQESPEGDLPSSSWLLTRLAVFWGGLLLLLILGTLKYPSRPMQLFSTTLSGSVYIALPLIFLVVLLLQKGQQQYNPLFALSLLLLSWANDTGAYLSGSRWGRHKLLPAVSPGKSWEGVFGGLILTLLLGFLLNHLVPIQGNWLIPALLASLFGPLGDLLESALKRRAGVKDSGRILPGHGGALDRFDAFLFHLPFTAGYLLFCM